MPKQYPIKLYNVIKILYVRNEMSPETIADLLGAEGPSAKTVQRWALKRNEDGKNWNDERGQRLIDVAETMTKEDLINTVWTDIYRLLADKQTDPIKRADALSKLQSFVDKLDDPRLKINTLLEFLQDFTEYIADNFTEFMKSHGDEFKAIVTGYRKERLNRFAK